MEINIQVTHRNNQLKSLRLAAGLSQSQLAKATGLNVRTLQHYEQGSKDLNAAKLATLLKICNALGCRLEDILNDPTILDELDKYEETK